MNALDLFNLKWSFEHLGRICDKQQQGARRLVVRYCESCPIVDPRRICLFAAGSGIWKNYPDGASQ